MPIIQSQKDRKKEKNIRKIKKIEKSLESMINFLETEDIKKSILSEISNKKLKNYSDKGKMLFKTVYLENRLASNTIEKSFEVAKSITDRNDKQGQVGLILLKAIQKQLKSIIKEKKINNKKDKKNNKKEIEEIELKKIIAPGTIDEEANPQKLLGK